MVVARAEGRLPNLLLTGEHPPVVTLGRKTPGGFVGAAGTDVVGLEEQEVSMEEVYLALVQSHRSLNGRAGLDAHTADVDRRVSASS